MGATKDLAEMIAEVFEGADVFDVGVSSADEVMKYDLLLLGSSTWGAGELQDDWYGFIDQLKKKDLSGKKVALFGCGDSESYGDTFCDALRIIYDELQACGCVFVGAYEPKDYLVTDSMVCKDGKFLGLAIDDTNEAGKTKGRLEFWAGIVRQEAVSS